MEVNRVSFTGMKRDRTVLTRTSVAWRGWRDSLHLIGPFGYTAAHTSQLSVFLDLAHLMLSPSRGCQVAATASD